MFSTKPLPNKRAQRRRLSAVITGGLIMTLMVVGGVIGFSGLFQSQDLASQAAGSMSCGGRSAGSTWRGATGTESCSSNQQPAFTCVEVTITGSKNQKTKVLQAFKTGCVTTAPLVTGAQTQQKCADAQSTCNIGSTTCGSAFTKTGSCSDRQDQGVCCKKTVTANPLTSLANLTKPAPAANTQPAQTAPATNPSQGSAPQANQGTGGQAPAAPLAPQPGVEPTCEVTLNTKTMTDQQIAAQGKPLTDDVLAKYITPITSYSFGNQVAFHCNVTSGGPVVNVWWALYRVENNTYVAKLSGSKNANSSLLDQSLVNLQPGDHFECVPTYIGPTGVETEGKKCKQVYW